MKALLFLIVLACEAIGVHAQKREIANVKYNRSSIYSILLHHPSKQYDEQIVEVFHSIPMPDKYDNHNLNIRTVFGSKEGDAQLQEKAIARFLYENQVGRRLLAKWFNRNKTTGVFNTKLLAERGTYDAGYIDQRMSEFSVRGKALLADAGEKLIGNTYVVVNDISYVDKSNTAAVFGGILALGATALSVRDAISTGNTNQKSTTTELASQAANTVSSIEGFKVKVTSYLYRLEWNEGVADAFYGIYYMDEPDAEKKSVFDKEMQAFQLKYVGNTSVTSGNITTRGVVKQEDMIRKVCTRAIDESIAMLQHQYEAFRVKVPLYSISPLSAKIGTKENVNLNSKYEVLEAVEDENGRIDYKRVGIIKPIQDKIWENQYMAEYEEDKDLKEKYLLGSTQFEKVSGSDFEEGMLIREIE